MNTSRSLPGAHVPLDKGAEDDDLLDLRVRELVSALNRGRAAGDLAAALTFRDSSGMRVPFVTADARQREAAEPAGLSILWVG